MLSEMYGSTIERERFSGTSFLGKHETNYLKKYTILYSAFSDNEINRELVAESLQ